MTTGRAGPGAAVPRPGASLPVGEVAALLMAWPTGVGLCASHADEHDIAGTVADVAFRGRGYEHAIEISGHGRLTSVFPDARAERGEHVGVRLNPHGCHRVSVGPARRTGRPRPPPPSRLASCLTLDQSMPDA